MHDRLNDLKDSLVEKCLDLALQIEDDDVCHELTKTLQQLKQFNVHTWIPVHDITSLYGTTPVVLIEEKVGGRKIHTGNFEANISEISGRFDFDMPKVTHVCIGVQPPIEENDESE